jgi:Na+-driven multidrug efflux pump
LLDYIAEMISKTLLGVEAGRAASTVNVLAVAVAAGLAFALIGPLGVAGACLALVIANLVRMIGGAIAITMLVGSERSRKQAQGVTIGGRS